MDNIKKLKRTGKLVSVLSKYGFETLITQTGLKKTTPESHIENDETKKEVFSLTVYERIRMTLEELGPAYVKLGQLMSNRDDIFPEELTVELQKLQDNVSVEEMDVPAILKEELKIEPDEVLYDISSEPVAAASLSQVYTATLKSNNQKIIIKIKRKGIKEIIEADILIMKDFAQMLERFYDMARSIGIIHIVNTFDKAITSELSFKDELANMERFRRNFAKEEVIYVPVTYPELSGENVLTMEFIDGIKISEKQELADSGLNTKLIAEKVVNSYMEQIIKHGFFHADPHSGNIFVLRDERIVFIDYGSMGKMYPGDMDNVGNFIIYVLRKDVKRLLRVIKKIAVKYRIPNEKDFERELYEFLDMLNVNSVEELDMGVLVKRFSKLLNENRIVLPDYVYLLAKGVVLLEGIGRELGMENSVMEYIEPYGRKLILERLEPKYITSKVIDKAYNLSDKLEDLPNDLTSLIQKLNNNQMEVNHRLHGLADIKNTINRLVIALLAFALAIGSSILILAKMPPLIGGVSVIGFIGFAFAGIMSIILLFIILRNKKEKD